MDYFWWGREGGVSVFGAVGGDMDVGNQEWIGEDRGMGAGGGCHIHSPCWDPWLFPTLTTKAH